MTQSSSFKLYMLLLGSKAASRNVEQHDFYFGIARTLKELIPNLKTFWPEAGSSLHIDGYREVTNVDGYKIEIFLKNEQISKQNKKLFFINLGGYFAGRLEERHSTLLTMQDDRSLALKAAKNTEFYKTNSVKNIKGANSHIDEKYGVDVDDIYCIEDILSSDFKEKYQIVITPDNNSIADEIHLGYFQLKKIMSDRI